jgi:hypothetical protein
MRTSIPGPLEVLAGQAVGRRVARRHMLKDGAFPRALLGPKCGIYILEFTNGEAYVGQASEVRRRLAQHRDSDTHSDFASLCFLSVGRRRLADVERQTISACERAGIKLRNHVYASFNFKPSELDEVVAPEFLDDFCQGGKNDLRGVRPEQEDLRRKHAQRLSQLKRHPKFDEVVNALRFYLRQCVPAPLRTELGYWSVSCLPQRRGGRLLACINIHWQEVLYIEDGEFEPMVRLNVAGTPLVEAGQLREDELTPSGYVPGGADQLGLALPLSEFETVFAEQGVIEAARLLNVRLMRKGKCNFGRSHCLELADLLLT